MSSTFANGRDEKNVDSGITAQLVRELQSMQTGALPDHVIHQAKRCLLDYLGVTIAGSRLLQEQGRQLLEMNYETRAGSTVLGFGTKAGLETCTFINGLSSHVAEMDDGVRHGMIHPGAPIISALLPVAERYRVKGDNLIAGIVVGYEAALRLASAMQPSHYKRGFHPTATCGSLGAAMGVAAMLEFSASEMENALAAAAVSASGSLKVVEDGSQLKPFNVGRAALVGLLSAMTARAGLAGPPDALSGDTGFAKMMSDSFDVKKVREACPEGFWIQNVYVKPYAACRHAHPGIEGCLRIRQETSLQPEYVQDIRITTYGGLSGRHDHADVSGVDSARMSIPFSVAIALNGGSAGINDFVPEIISDPAVRSLASRVRIVEDQAFTAQVPAKRSARVEIATIDGKVHHALVEFPKGEPENPLSDDELADKFRSLMEFAGRSQKSIREMVGVIWDLPDGTDALYEILSC